MWIGIGNTILRCGGGVIVDPDLATYMTGLSTPLSTSQKTLLNSFYITTKSGLGLTNIYDYFDCMYIIGGETKESSYRNLVKRAHDITVSIEPTWTALEGSRGNGTSQFLNLNYNPNTQGVNFTQNNAGYGIYSRTNGSIVGIDMGAANATVTNAAYIHLKQAAVFYGILNNYAASNVNDLDVTIPDTFGMYMITRNGPAITNLVAYKNKTIHTYRTGTDVTSSPPNFNVYVCAANVDGAASNFCTRQYSLVFWSKYITEANRDVIVDAFETYMDANGKGVI